jgi:hypothetical protein
MTIPGQTSVEVKLSCSFSSLISPGRDCPEIGGSHRFSNDRRRLETTTKRPVLCKGRRIHGTHAGKGKVGYIDPVPIPPNLWTLPD